MERYAVLLSGGVNRWLNHSRYLNDLKLAYSTLVQHYGFDKDKVFVLYADGPNIDLDGDGQSEIAFAASKAHLNPLFAELRSKMSRDALFCMFVTNHGGQTVPGTMNVHIYLWDDAYIMDTELAELLSKLP